MVKNVNAFGVEIDDNVDLAVAPATTNTLLDNGIYDAIIEKIEFTKSKSDSPMLVFYFKIMGDGNVANLREYRLLNGGSKTKEDGSLIKWESPVVDILKKIFECWDVPKEYRNIKCFNYLGNAQANLDPAITLMHGFKQYGDVAKIHNSYVKKMMVRVDLGQKPRSDKPEFMQNYIVKFVKLSENSNQILQNNKAEIVEETNPFGVSNTSKDPFSGF